MEVVIFWQALQMKPVILRFLNWKRGSGVQDLTKCLPICSFTLFPFGHLHRRERILVVILSLNSRFKCARRGFYPLFLTLPSPTFPPRGSSFAKPAFIIVHSLGLYFYLIGNDIPAEALLLSSPIFQGLFPSQSWHQQSFVVFLGPQRLNGPIQNLNLRKYISTTYNSSFREVQGAATQKSKSGAWG